MPRTTPVGFRRAPLRCLRATGRPGPYGNGRPLASRRPAGGDHACRRRAEPRTMLVHRNDAVRPHQRPGLMGRVSDISSCCALRFRRSRRSTLQVSAASPDRGSHRERQHGSATSQARLGHSPNAATKAWKTLRSARVRSPVCVAARTPWPGAGPSRQPGCRAGPTARAAGGRCRRQAAPGDRQRDLVPDVADGSAAPSGTRPLRRAGPPPALCARLPHPRPSANDLPVAAALHAEVANRLDDHRDPDSATTRARALFDEAVDTSGPVAQRA